MASDADTPRTLLSTANVSKTFSGARVLRDVELDVVAGEIHGLVGANGSGKSTLIKILSGYHAPDHGARLRLQGEDVSLPLQPGQARSHGLAFVHQNLALADGLSVLDNFYVGRYGTGPGWRIRWGQARRDARQKLAEFKLDVAPGLDVARLGPAERSIVAIARAVDEMTSSSEQGVIVLDEPTASLAANEVNRLLDAMKDIAGAGNGVVFVSHRLAEVLSVTDRITVLREGQVVATVPTASIDEAELVELMVGRLLARAEHPARDKLTERAPVLRAEDLSGDVVSGLQLTVAPGEIVGVTGLVGSGFEEVPYLLAGAQRHRQGTVEVGGKTLSDGASPKEFLKAGVVLVPGDRVRAGAAQTLSVRENVTLPRVGDFRVRGLLRHRLEASDTAGRMIDLEVVLPSVHSPMTKLSGGNQQRAIIAKWLAVSPHVLLLHEPTHGVDVRAREVIFRVVKDAAARGCAVVVASVEPGDLATLCERVLVFDGGVVKEELVGAAINRDDILEATLRASFARSPETVVE